MSKFVVFALIALLIVLLGSTIGPAAHGQVVIIGTSIVPDFQTVTPVVSAPTPVACPPTAEPAAPAPTPTAAPPEPTPTAEPDRPTPVLAPPTEPPPTATPIRTATPTATATATPPEPTPTTTPPAARTAAARPTATQPVFTVTATPVHTLALLAGTQAPPVTPAAPAAPTPAPLLPVLPQVSLSVLPALLALLGALIFLAAERIRSALVAQTRQQRLIALAELALRRAVQQQTLSYPTPAAALSALRQIIYDATGADCGQLVAVAQAGLLVVRDVLQQHYAFTPHDEQAQALARRYHGRVLELSSASAGLLAPDELTAAQRTLLPAASLTPRGALIWHLVRYDPRPQYRLHRPRGLRLGRQHGGDLVS